jgi:DNA-directed RNA polymerase specialized sigma24 family protein
MNSKDDLIPQEPIPAGAHEFSRKVQGLLDGKPKDDATVSEALEGMDETLDLIASRLYSMASMLVGEGEDSIRLVETAVERTDISACSNPTEARRSSRQALCSAAIELIATRKAGVLAAPEHLVHASTCIEDDDLESAGISRAELESMLAGPNRASIKNWIESLPMEMRVIFVLRAVAGFSTEDTAALLANHGGQGAEGWDGAAVSEVFRQGLCSLASQLIHATTAK